MVLATVRALFKSVFVHPGIELQLFDLFCKCADDYWVNTVAVAEVFGEEERVVIDAYFEVD
jgi:hypothetical protein